MKTKYKGFTLIEITLVMVLISILIAITTPLVSNVIARNDVGSAHESLYNALLRAQQLSKNQYKDSQWRVCLDNTNKQYTITSGTCSDPTNAEIIKISSNITISSDQTLDILFKSISGELDNTSNSITITLTGGGASKSIIINKKGILSKSPTAEEIAAAISPPKLTVTSCTYADKKISIPYTAGEVGYNYASQTINSTGVTGLTATATLLGDGPLATGGDTVTDIIVNNDIYRVHTFTTVGTSSLNVTQGGEFEYLVVAGGGGGGMDMGGGGGGGGVLTGNLSLTPQSYNLTVGVGGTGAPAAGTNGQPSSHQYTIPATSGGNSSFASLTAIGGGRGGSSYRGYTPGIAGGNGGSGGGAGGYNDNAGTFFGGTGVTGQGFSGGNSINAYYSGGGGGAGGAGIGSNNQPNGGPGILSNILGTPYYWAGGGGGSGYSGIGGNGGIGGGGGGAVGTTTGGAGINNGSPGGGGSTNSQTNTPGGNAGANTGGGGGGGSHYNANNKGGNGGSGIVIVRYKLRPLTITPAQNTPLATGGDTRDIIVGNDIYRVHTFTTVGASSLNVIQGGQVEYLVVAGGGGGGSDIGGGGGAGGVLQGSTSLSANQYTLSVGEGGSGATGYNNFPPPGGNGGNSTAFGFTAIGGGGGSSGHYQSGAYAGPPPTTGGSGGGASARYGNGTMPGAAGTAGQGTSGGSGIYNVDYYSGGGGGAGSNTQVDAVNATRAGNGGDGVSSLIMGTAYFFGGGGGGAGHTGGPAGNGGLGGGGGGSRWTGGVVGTGGTGGLNNGTNGANAYSKGGNAGQNTGSGGGGGSHQGHGGDGGSGIVIVRYKKGALTSTLASSGTLEYEVTGTPSGVGTANFDFSNIINTGVGCNNSNIVAVNVTTGVLATGGDITTDITVGTDTYRVHTFTTVGTSNLNVTQGGEFEYLVVGGGGGGQAMTGGGAGGYRSSVAGESSGGGGLAELPLILTPNTSYTVMVGDGGAVGNPASMTEFGKNGGNSSFAGIISLGGGGGSVQYNGSGLSGGSGGGGHNAGGSGTSVQGLAGGTGTPGSGGCAGNGGGGGGAATTGSGRNGGNGIISSINGTPVTRAGGGAGEYNLDCGGAVGTAGTGGGGGSRVAGQVNTGGGGGSRAAGGSGIVIVRYKLLTY